MAVALSGCSYSPGLYLGGNERIEQEIPGIITQVTPELLEQQNRMRFGIVSSDAKVLFGRPKPYAIGPGDILSVVVWDHPELSIPSAGGAGLEGVGSASGVGNGYNVSAGGQIQFPYIGVLKVAGLTEYEVRGLLTQQLARVLKNPQVTVRVQSYRNGRVYLDGEVQKPGVQVINDIPMTLPEAIGRAGGFTALADRSAIAVTRDNKTTIVNLPQLIESGINPNNILLQADDLVHVLNREDAKVFILGEVLFPGSQTLREGHLSLSEALGEAGGLNPSSSDPKQIFILRNNRLDEKPEIFHIDASTPMAYVLTEDFQLQAHDVVYVDPTALVRWSRVINLLLPSSQAANVTLDVVRRR